MRSDTPPTVPGISSGPHTPTTGSAPAKSMASVGPTEPEYLIVLINPPEGAGITGLSPSGAASAEKTGMGRFMNKSKGNVLEKARADFNTSRKEHVVQISRLPPVPAQPLGRSGLHSMDPTIWAELLTKMREAASATFTTTIEAQEDEISRCGVTRGQQGWDFCSYFLAKDSLARTLEAVGLKDDAVGQYEDLEIVFAQAMQNGAVSFAPVGGDDEGDDSLPLLDVGKKPYADLIRRKEISLFDFWCYLFARKSALLGKMGRVAAVMREAPLFISAVGRMLKRNKRLSSQWIESWIFSAALDVVEQCQAWLIQRSGAAADDDQLSPAFHSNKSELLDVARRQLDRIGIEAGHLPPSEPFAFPASDASDNAIALGRERDLPPLPEAAGLGAPVELNQKRGSSRPELQRAVESREHFDSYYLALCERILSGWKAASRKRDALHIRTITATLNYLRGKYQMAYDNLAALAEAYASAKFTGLEGRVLAMQLACHSKLGKPRDRVWVAAALAALRVSVQAASSSKGVEAEVEQWTNPTYLCEQLRSASAALQKEMPISAFPLFSITIPQATARLAGTEDGSLLMVDVTSLLPCSQAVEDVRVCLTTSGNGVLWYTSGKTEITPGMTKVELFCPHPAHGVYTVDVTQIRIAKLIFQYDCASQEQPIVVRVPKDGDAPIVAVRLPRRIDLDLPRAVEVRIGAGRDGLDMAELSIVSSAGGASVVDCTAAQLSSESQLDLTSSSSSITIKGQPKGTHVVLLLPLLQVPESGILDAIATLTYTRPSSGASQRHVSSKPRILRIPIQLRTALPLGVNVQDFFRSSCLLSKFTISAGGGGSIRLQPVSLVPEDGEGAYKIESCSSSREATVTPRQPATYLFRIVKAAGGVKGGTRLRLAVQYRTLVEDAVEAAVEALDREVEKRDLKGLGKGEPARRLVESALEVYVRERLDLPAFSITGQVRTGVFDEDFWRGEIRSWGESSLSLSELIELIKATLDAILPGSIGEEAVWQTLTIPVEVPNVDFVNAVTLSLGPSSLSEEQVFVVGQPIQLTVSIQTSTLWASQAGKEEEMLYDIQPDFDCWLVDGVKRGTFSASDATHEVTLTVVPLKTGTLALPTVVVRPIEGGVATCETYITNQGLRVQIVPARSTRAYFVGLEGNGANREKWKSVKGGVGAQGLDRMRNTWQSQQFQQQQASQMW